MPESAIANRTKLVTIEQLTEPTGGSFPTGSWTTLATAWMERIDTSGDERFTAEQLSAPSQVRWRMPYQSNMDPEAIDVAKVRRLTYKGRIYDILSGTPIGEHCQIELETKAKAG